MYLVLIDELADDGCRFAGFALIVFDDHAILRPLMPPALLISSIGHLDAVSGRLAEAGSASGKIAVVADHNFASTIDGIGSTTTIAAFAGKTEAESSNQQKREYRAFHVVLTNGDLDLTSGALVNL